MKRLFFIIFIFHSISFLAQKSVVVELTYPLGDNISFAQGKEIALKKAKEEALRRAGVGEHTRSFTTQFKTNINDDVTNIFSSNILLNIEGSIQSWKYIDKPEKLFDPDLREYYIKLSIEAKVKKYSSKLDPQFVARIDGVLPVYQSNKDNIQLKIIPSMNCYLKVFYLDEDEANIVYPLHTRDDISAEGPWKDKILLKDEEKIINYLEPDTDKDIETGKLIIVITKKQYDFTDSFVDEDGYYTLTQVDKILQWIMKIEPENRSYYFKQFSITR